MYFVVSVSDGAFYVFFNDIDDSYFTSWAGWADCSSDCEGVTYKTRDCQVTDPDQCTSLTNVTIQCNTETCPGK